MEKELPHKKLLSWALYDFANSSFFTVVVTYIFPAYFVKSVAADEIHGTYLWGNAIALAALVVALASPLLGAFADNSGKRMPLLNTFTSIGIVATALLWYSYPTNAALYHTLAAVVVSTIAFEIAVTFYNALLPAISPPAYIGRVSGWAWGLGYVGGLLSLIICLEWFVRNNIFSLPTEEAANVRICAPFIALWIFLFSRPLFWFVDDRPRENSDKNLSLKKSMSTLLATIKNLRREKKLLFFFSSRLFYVDALNTLFAFGGVYAAGTFQMDLSEVILLGILLNITAAIGAAAFAWIDDWLGPSMTIKISLIALLLSGTAILFIHSKMLFWLFAALLGTFVGPVQAASRSLLVRIVPNEKITEMFGLFALSGKATNFLGPWLVALLTKSFQSQRAGMSIIVLFLLLGLALISQVDEK